MNSVGTFVTMTHEVLHLDGSMPVVLTFGKRDDFDAHDKTMNDIKAGAAFIVKTYPESNQQQTMAFRNAVHNWVGMVNAAEKENLELLPSIVAVKEELVLLAGRVRDDGMGFQASRVEEEESTNIKHMET